MVKKEQIYSDVELVVSSHKKDSLIVKDSLTTAVEGVDAVAILTEWDEFINLNNLIYGKKIF